MGKHSLRQTWERVRRPLGYVCNGMIIMIVAMVGLFWYYTGRPSSMFEFSGPWKSSKAIMPKMSIKTPSLTVP